MAIQRNRYLKYHPRNFANEYVIYVGDKETIDLLTELLDIRDSRTRNQNSEWFPITKKDAIHYGRTLPHRYQGTPNQWYGGFVGDDLDSRLETLDEILDLCESLGAKEEIRERFRAKRRCLIAQR